MHYSPFKKPPEKILGEPMEYIKKVGLNQVLILGRYISSLSEVDPSVQYFGTNKKTEFQSYLDNAFQSVIDSDKKIIKEVTGDADFIKCPKRQDIYKKITNSSVKMQFMMDVEPWTLQNAELLASCGVEVSHRTTQEHYHFGTWADVMMFTLSREPANEKARKVVSEPQKEKDVNYLFLSTNQNDFVKYTNNLFEDLMRSAISFEDQKAQLSKGKNEGDDSKFFNF